MRKIFTLLLKLPGRVFWFIANIFSKILEYIIGICGIVVIAFTALTITDKAIFAAFKTHLRHVSLSSYMVVGVISLLLIVLFRNKIRNTFMSLKYYFTPEEVI